MRDDDTPAAEVEPRRTSRKSSQPHFDRAPRGEEAPKPFVFRDWALI